MLLGQNMHLCMANQLASQWLYSDNSVAKLISIMSLVEKLYAKLQPQVNESDSKRSLCNNGALRIAADFNLMWQKQLLAQIVMMLIKFGATIGNVYVVMYHCNQPCTNTTNNSMTFHLLSFIASVLLTNMYTQLR